ncbi:cystine transport system substrate-binding protein [Alkalibacterium subtropicum]|uniref:Cystine transport system substrate-binding protein n=1 Tax=Alkalibacterium subtropicum TaxID=753702 RepID=A0A1I1FMK0_9LACT|nr:3D domain-containing protein [Alkalibacterium subtropicum]SFB98333.1 cystine transport system substrate-binding protein [Alkalibacterium subtropicum]
MKKRLVSLAVIGLTFLQLNNAQPASAESLDTIKDQQEQTKQEIQSLQENVNTVLEEVNTLNETLVTLEETITEKESDIEMTEKDITKQEAIVSARLEQASERLHSLQVNEISQNIVLTLLESESISDMFNRALVLMRLTDAGNEQIELAKEEAQKLVDLKEQLVEARQELKGQQEEAVAQKEELDGKVASLQTMIMDNQSELSSLVQREAEEVARIEEARRAAREEAARAAAERDTDAQDVSTSSSDNQTSARQTVKTSAPEKVESKPAAKKESKPAQTSGRTLRVEATGYSTKQPGLSTHTYMGIDLRINPRVIAVDPSVIPLGSMVEVEGMGVYIAGDTGGAINGKIIDIHFKTVAEALQWGRRHVTIRVLN